MIRNIIFFSSALILFVGCSQFKSDNVIEQRKNEEYQKFKNKFDNKFLDNFPVHVNSTESFITCNTNVDKNDIGLFLYEYNVDLKELDSIVTASKSIAIANYIASDSCLLIVNRFDTNAITKSATIWDQTLISRDCYQSLFPIPNFRDYQFKEEKSYINLDSTFEICVIESKPIFYLSQYKMNPDLQMPEKWKNGYSKGVATSRQRKTVIYWSIAW